METDVAGDRAGDVAGGGGAPVNGPEDREADLERELRSHLEAAAEELEQSGLTAQEARFAAQRKFGNTTRVKEEVREVWGRRLWQVFRQDTGYALRTLRKSPGFAATALLTLALGIGASTAVFTAVETVLLKPLGYRDSNRLVVVWERVRTISPDPLGPNVRHANVWRNGSKTLSNLALYRQSTNGLLLGSGHPRVVGTVVGESNLMDLLEARPLLGRGFLPEDGVEGRDHVAILSYSLWQSAFGGEVGAIGKTIRLADVPRQVIGVMPQDFEFPGWSALRAFGKGKAVRGSALPPEIFIPAVMHPDELSWSGEWGNWVALGRLRAGHGTGEAEAELDAIEARINDEIPANQRQRNPGTVWVQPMREALAGESRRELWLLMAAVMGLELIACLNLANAQLGRSLSRQREAAVRVALGAPKWRLVWSALAENVVLGVVGCAAGVALAALGVSAFRRDSPVDLPRMAEMRLDGSVLAFSNGLAVLSIVASGLVPALRTIGTDPQLALQQNGARTMGSRRGHRLSRWLIGAQVFGCTVLLLVTGLFTKSLLTLLRQDIGFETAHVAVAEVRLSGKTYEADEKRAAFDQAVLSELQAIAGVQRAGLISAMPLDGETWIDAVQRVDRPEPEPGLVNLRWASAGYFEAVNTKLVAGRFLDERDRNLKSMVLSEGEARGLFGGDRGAVESAIGKSVRTGSGKTFTVVGVVADSRNTSLREAPVKMAWLDYNDNPPYATYFVARGAQSADELVGSMRQAIWRHAPEVTIGRAKTLESQLRDSVAMERFQTTAMAAFGAAALLLAMLGIYGVLSYSVEMRRPEIGVRMALGAARGSIYALTFREAGGPVIGGLAAGLLASLWAGQAIEKLLFGVKAVDTLVMASVTGMFLAAGLLAAYLPARRAASVDPMETLRGE